MLSTFAFNFNFATLHLGELYRDGLGVAQNREAACEQFLEAAHNLNAPAMAEYSMLMIADEEYGMAVAWLEEAVKRAGTSEYRPPRHRHAF